MGCVKSSQLDQFEKGYGGAYNFNQNTWLNRPPDGYHWEQCKANNKCHSKNYERQIREGCGCEGVAIAGIAVMGGATYGAAAVAHGLNAAESCEPYGMGCGAADAAGCGAGGCGGCGGCGA